MVGKVFVSLGVAVFWYAVIPGLSIFWSAIIGLWIFGLMVGLERMGR